MNVRKLTPGRIVLYLLLVLFALYYLAPLYVMLVNSVKTMDEINSGNMMALPRHIQFESWQAAWSSAPIGTSETGLKPFFWNSIKMAVPAVFFSTMLGAFNGYVFAHWRFKGSEALFTAMLIGCFIPFQVVILPMARILGEIGLANSTTGLVLVHVIYGTAFTTLFFRNYYIGVPEELIKAARIDGAGFFLIFRKIVLPISGPIFVVCVIWQFTQIWNDFLFGIIFASNEAQPITVGLNNMVNTSSSSPKYNVNMAGAIIAALPTLLVYLVAGRYFVRGLTAGAVKG
ncbi:MAG: hypothetical protein RL748_994 [Pseudomonadota bacterium]